MAINTQQALSDFSVNTQISGRLLDNALDLFAASVALLKQRGTRYSSQTAEQLKPAIVSIATAIEIIIKSKIADSNWREILTDPVNVNAADALAGNTKTIGLPVGLKKLKSICNITIPKNELKEIDRIIEVRNKIVHYHITIDSQQCATLISIGISLFIEFYKHYIFSSFYEDKNRVSGIGKSLKDVPEYVTVRTKVLMGIIADMEKPITYHFNECPDCLQGLYVLAADKISAGCLFCDREIEIKEMAAHHSMDGCDPIPCKHCSYGFMALHDKDNDRDCWQCVYCGFYINRPEIWMTYYNPNTHSDDSIRAEYKNSKR